MSGDLVLSIEAAVGGGSVALLRRDEIAAHWHSTEMVSRSEELLARIADLLDSTSVKRKDITRIAVSNGPGSYTGIRIGIATAMGLSKALSIPCVGISVLNAISLKARPATGHLTVVPIGRDGYCWQSFEAGRRPISIGTGNFDTLTTELLAKPDLIVIAQTDAFAALHKVDGFDSRLLDAGKELAVAIAIASGLLDDGLEPFYARDTAVVSLGEKV